MHRTSFLAVVAAGLMLCGMLWGCSALKVDHQTETEKQTQAPAVTEKVTEKPTESATEKVTEKPTEPQTEAVIQNVLYTSQDQTVSIVLPDSTWKVTQDADEMRVFSSGAAMINIVHAASESELKRTSIYKEEDELKESLTRQYPEANAFEIQSFEAKETDYLSTYEYVVKYNSKSMWAYTINYGILAQDEAYLVTGTVTDDNKTLLNAVKASVETFTVLTNPKFQLPDPSETEEAMTLQPETSAVGDEEANTELAALMVYAKESTKQASDDLNVRSEPSRNAEIIDSLAVGDKVRVTAETPQWYRILLNDHVGYVIREYMADPSENASAAQTPGTENTDPAAQQTEAQENTAPGQEEAGSMAQAEYVGEVPYETPATFYTTSDVNIRTEPDTGSSIVDGLGSGLPVQVIGETDNWFVVSENGQTGYIRKDFLSASYEDDVPADEAPDYNDEGPANEEEPEQPEQVVEDDGQDSIEVIEE